MEAFGATLSRIEANMQIKGDARQQMDDIMGKLDKMSKEFHETVRQIKTESDKKHDECNAAIQELKKQFDDLKKGIGETIVHDGRKKPYNDATRASSADTRSQTGGNNLKQEVKDKLERKVVVDGFMNNTTKETRETSVKDFLEGLGTMSNYGPYDVFAKGATGSKTIIQFETRDRASQFIRDNLKEIKLFKVCSST